MSNLSRRNFLKNSGIFGTAVGAASIFGVNMAFAQDMSGDNDDVQTIINIAATAELFAMTHYLAGINNLQNLDDVQTNYLKGAFISETDHYNLLLSQGAEPLATEFYVPGNLFDDIVTYATTTETAENVFIAAYLSAGRIFAELGEVALAVTAAQIVGVESEHRAIIRQLAGKLPNNLSYEQYLVNNPSEGVPTLQPFLDGETDGFEGPVAAPTQAEIDAVFADREMLGYGEAQPFAAIAAEADAMAEEEDSDE
ncbi:MAG: ferritin-like domain-containing protein [Aggregatilineales bacterium]